MTTAMSPHLPFLHTLRDALSEALTKSWSDVMPDLNEGLIHIEYDSRANQPVEWVKILSCTTWGYWNLICEYAMHQHPLGRAGLRFGPGYHSVNLSKSLEDIMQHQQMYAPLESAHHGLIQVSPPGASN